MIGRLACCAAGMIAAFAAQADPLRIATFNTELQREGPGLLLRDILREIAMRLEHARGNDLF